MIEVAAAIIENGEGQILIARRRAGKAQAGMWEFPGGKLEPGESPQACLQRELLEEMNLAIAPYAPFAVNAHDYGDTAIRLIAYRATLVAGELQLRDHDDYRWVAPSELSAFSFAPADKPFVALLMKGV
ncbi:(deoxy)nucleoside triphosphate pyrophosphohydrolase [Paenibacillus sp. IB182496]|uniref:8-oxo-dGTP diphosphatase n=1 Tax=Paenibacillus sabuli TaxID=2772509 RepID=A0A927GTV2_9BACL|nr:(deoxy)nucleoside triphosphate pyrophosphohydrolase [Paenibacillus sabuli]MBD2847082.1 (deoxy)nucleoside triphosphate pyrophosphohydrolase [Paenibacillus sabuli]